MFFGDGQFAALRHLVVFDQFPHQAALGFSGRDHRTAGAALHHSGEGTEVQFGHFLLCAMTLHAVLFQNRQYLRLEKGIPLRGCRDGNGGNQDTDPQHTGVR